MNSFLRSSLLACVAAFSTNIARAQSFGNAYFFGDSLTDCCIFGRTTNNQAPNWADQLAPAIGATYNPSSRTNFAAGGAQSGRFNVVSDSDVRAGFPTGFTSQITRFTAQGGTIGSRDIAGIWIGTNDIWVSAQTTSLGVPPIGARPTVAALTDYITGNVRSGVNTLVSQGFRNVVLVSPYDLGVSDVYRVFGSDDAATRALATQYSEAVRNSLAALYTPGVNTYFVDMLELLRRVQANPAVYGFDKIMATENCSATPGCSAAPLSVQKRFVFNDFIHTTSGFDQLMVNYLANSINARASLPAQGDVGEAVGLGFSGILLNRLDAYRDFNAPVVVHGTYTADLPGKTIAPNAIPIMLGSPVSLFVEGAYAGIDRNARSTPTGPSNPNLSADFAGVTAGIEYRITPNLLIGAAFNYFSTSTELRGASNARLDLDSYQGGIFASYNDRNFFADGAFTYGTNNYGLNRPGVIDTLTAALDGNTLTVAGKIGYLFDVGAFRLGPIAELTYANVHLGSYRERGDSLLTLGVRQQDFDGLTGGAGLQIRAPLPLFGSRVSSFVNLTAQHDFLDGVRTITSFSTNAPALLINTSAGRRGDDIYGKVAGGLSVDLGSGLSGVMSASATFGRSYGDDYLVSTGIRYRF